jgi:hypothetical protein
MSRPDAGPAESVRVVGLWAWTFIGLVASLAVY